MDSLSFKDNSLCSTCLTTGRMLKLVEDEKMKYFYLNTISEMQLYTMSISIPSICWECYALLKKAVKFREQVKDCYKQLQDYSQENLIKGITTKTSNLKQHVISQINILPNEQISDVDGEINLGFTVKQELNKETTVISENVVIKKENQSSSDDDTSDVFCNEINNDVNETRNKIEKTDKVSKKTKKCKTRKLMKTKIGKKTKIKINNEEKTSEIKEKIICKECNKSFRSIKMYKIHCKKHYIRKKERKKPEKGEEMLKCRVQCPECDKTFSYKSGLNNHQLAVHKMNSNFQCEECGKIFRWRNSLNKHMIKHEMGQKMQAAFCNDCGIGFTTICSYKRHMLNSLKHVTQEQYRFICDHCNSKFANKTKLRDHIEEKHLQRAFQCHICLKQSKNRVCLDQHIRNVHKGRPNNKICHHCGKGFPTNLQLDSHIRSHTGEKPFLCKFCPSTFSQRSNLNKHHKQVHLNLKAKRTVKIKEDKLTNQNREQHLNKPSVVLHYDVEKDFLI